MHWFHRDRKKEFLHKMEVFVDRSIPYTLVILLFVILAEMFAPEKTAPFHAYISFIDWSIIAIFVTDLLFKYKRSNSVKGFFKQYWLEIIATLPAFMLVKVIEEFRFIANLDETLAMSQEAFEFGERVGSKASRLQQFERFLRPLSRLPRFFKAFHFYEHPRHRILPRWIAK